MAIASLSQLESQTYRGPAGFKVHLELNTHVLQVSGASQAALHVCLLTILTQHLGDFIPCIISTRLHDIIHNVHRVRLVSPNLFNAQQTLISNPSHTEVKAVPLD